LGRSHRELTRRENKGGAGQPYGGSEKLFGRFDCNCEGGHVMMTKVFVRREGGEESGG